MADHQHILAHILQALLHLEYLDAAVEAVLFSPVDDQLELACRELIVFLRGQVFLAGNELFPIQGLVLLVFPLVLCHLCLELELVLLEGEFLLLHRNQGVAQDVLLLCKLGLGVEDLEVEVVVAQPDYHVAGLNLCAFLSYDFLDYAAFLRADLDGGHRLDLTADADVVIELSLTHFADCQCVGIDAEGRRVVPEKEPEDECENDCAEPVREGFFGEGRSPAFLFFNYLVHCQSLFLLIRTGLYRIFRCSTSRRCA